MFAYATIGSTNFEVSVKFFDAVLATLGHARLHDYFDNGWVAYGNPKDAQNPATPLLWLCKTPFNGQPANAGNGNMVSFAANSRAQVNAFHAAALVNGGTNEGEPGTREAYGPDLYIAYVRDPMGNKFSVMTRNPT